MNQLVDIWVGKFKSKKLFGAYLAESYGDDDSKPISLFAADQGETFYDHDFIESTFVKDAYDLAELFAGLSYSKSYFEAAKSAIEKVGIEGLNVVLLSFEQTISNPQSASGDGYSLHYLGKFEFVSTSGPVGEITEEDLRHLKILGGRKVVFEGQETSVIPLTMHGLSIGYGPMQYGIPTLDLSNLVEGIAETQVMVSALGDGLWEVEDLGNNGLTKLGSQAFNGERTMPWPGIRFSVGDIEFEWGMGSS